MPLFRRVFWLLFALGCPGLAMARGGDIPAIPAPANIKAAQMPPMPPLPKSPVDSFRELLAKNPAEREKFLASRPPEIRKRFEAKIKEYEAMSPEERDLRFRATQLRWYLLPLMQTPATNRTEQLAGVPEEDRGLVKARLLQWDALPAGLQKEFLEYGLTASYFVGQDSAHSDPARKPALDKMLPADLVKKIDYVSKLPPEQRQAMYDGFQHFFKLTDEDRQRTLAALSPEERSEMQKSLRAFMRLPKSQRDRCIRSFGQFTSMTEQEQMKFFRNAERWHELTPAERQAWRNLVNRFPPMPPMLPPLPPVRPITRPGVPVATNQSP